MTNDRATRDFDADARSLAAGLHPTPFALLGVHGSPDGSSLVVRTWAPGARRLEIVLDSQRLEAESIHESGLFQASFPEDDEPLRYRVSADGGPPAVDPYSLPPVHDAETFARLRTPPGRIHEFLGARTLAHEGVEGTAFAVWAPGARAVSVVGGFNDWSAHRHPMQLLAESGVWELFLPGVTAGALYKYRIVSRVDGSTALKADPCGRAMQVRPDSASVVPRPSSHRWRDRRWMDGRGDAQSLERPISIYEVHLSSWRRRPGAEPRQGKPGWMSYREIADLLVPYAAELGFTHLELLPVTEHPHDRSWGYQTLGYFAPTARHGSADDLRYLIDRAHRAGLGVILDWVPAHFPMDSHGLGRFDGTHLYEHADPRKGVHPDWGTYIFNLGRPEVVSFLVSSALYWIESFHFDGLRLDAVASMIYLDYSRAEGEWVPNEEGGRVNKEAVRFLRHLTETINATHPDVLVMAEESTAFPGVTQPVAHGGLGFDLKWNLGWMHDTLEVWTADPGIRARLYDRLTFGITYTFAERFLLPFSHDEVVHLKRSMLGKMPGPTLDRFANLRLLYGYMWMHPGKKLLFMGSELGVWNEWDAEGELDWALRDEPMHSGLRMWVADLNRIYRETPALHATDGDPAGFEWIDCHDRDRTTLAFLRWAPQFRDPLVVVVNLANTAWAGYRLAVPAAGRYQVRLCSDDPRYGGAGSLERRSYDTTPGELHGREQYIELTLPPRSAVCLAPVSSRSPGTGS